MGMDTNCRCSSSCSSPPGLSFRSFTVDNDMLKSVLMSPRLSSHHSMPLERTLHDEASVCWDSDKGLGSVSMNSVASNGIPTTKSTAELRKEIAILEVEIMHLENHLLSLYRTAFQEQLPAQSNTMRTPLHAKTPTLEDRTSQKMEPLMQRSTSFYSNQSSPARFEPFSSKVNGGSSHRSLADHLGSSELAEVLNTPDRLSEEMVRCISSIYCKLADPSHTGAGLLASPTSSLSSSSIFSSHNAGDSWSPYCNEDPTTNRRFQGFKEESIGRYASTVEVVKICLDNNSYSYASTMLQNFRSMVGSLEKVDPSNLKREQKLAFWINIHNALVMHAYLAYGTHNRVKSSTILKAAYNVGGHCINAYVIQSSILGIRSRNSAPWLQTLFSPGRIMKAGSTRHPYALEYPEPHVHFALCAGAYSDPVVRAYTAKTIFQDLKLARQEFIQANVFIHRQTKVLLPKLLDHFAKDMSLTMPELLEIVNGCLADVQQNAIRRCIRGRLDKYVHWLPQNQNFRYVIQGELANGIEAV